MIFVYKLFFLIGASGSGKTTIAKILESRLKNFQICYFDSIGVPSNEKMIEEFGSIEKWQLKKTIEWTKRIRNDLLPAGNVILDVQTRPLFIEKSCKKAGIKEFEIILFDCSDEVRKQRLMDRGNPELANDRMMNWSRLLREESQAGNYKVLDTSDLSIEQSVSNFISLIFF